MISVIKDGVWGLIAEFAYGISGIELRVCSMASLKKRMNTHTGKVRPTSGWTIRIQKAITKRLKRRSMTCLRQAVMANRLCRWFDVPCETHWGVVKDERQLSAHVWVTSGQRVLSGKDDFSRYAIMTAKEVKEDGIDNPNQA